MMSVELLVEKDTFSCLQSAGIASKYPFDAFVEMTREVFASSRLFPHSAGRKGGGDRIEAAEVWLSRSDVSTADSMLSYGQSTPPTTPASLSELLPSSDRRHSRVRHRPQQPLPSRRKRALGVVDRVLSGSSSAA